MEDRPEEPELDRIRRIRDLSRQQDDDARSAFLRDSADREPRKVFRPDDYPGRRAVVEIASHDYWVKIIEMLCQNWALIELDGDHRAVAWFFDDGARIFDRIEFPSPAAARAALIRNGFSRFDSNPTYDEFLQRPDAPFVIGASNHPPVYSSGKYWID